METVLPREIGAPLGQPGCSLRCPRPPEPSDPATRAPIRTSAPYSAADASGSSCVRLGSKSARFQSQGALIFYKLERNIKLSHTFWYWGSQGRPVEQALGLSLLFLLRAKGRVELGRAKQSDQRVIWKMEQGSIFTNL
jgi:hypothetical protein